MNIICFLFGHKISDFNDSGYRTCERCRAHEYYDTFDSNKWDNSGWLYPKPLFWIKWELYRLKVFFENLRFRYIGKNDLPF